MPYQHLNSINSKNKIKFLRTKDINITSFPIEPIDQIPSKSKENQEEEKINR